MEHRLSPVLTPWCSQLILLKTLLVGNCPWAPQPFLHFWFLVCSNPESQSHLTLEQHSLQQGPLRGRKLHGLSCAFQPNGNPIPKRTPWRWQQRISSWHARLASPHGEGLGAGREVLSTLPASEGCPWCTGSAVLYKRSLSFLSWRLHSTTLPLVEVYTTPAISPHDSPAGSSLRLSQGPNCLSRLGHTCRRGEPCGWRAQPGQFSSAAGSQEPSAQKVQPQPPLRASDQAWAFLLQAFSLWPEQGPPPQAPRAALRLQLGSPMRPGNCKSQRWHKCKVLQHHIAVQESLSFLEQLPLLPGEVREHILEGHTALRWVRCHGHSGRNGAPRGGRPGQAHLGMRLTPEPRCKMMSNNNNRMTSNAREAQAAVLRDLGDRARVEACRNVQSRRRHSVSCPIDGDTVSRPRSRGWGVTAPMRCGDRPATSLALPSRP